MEDPELRKSPLIGFRYPDLLQDKAPMAWKCWAESLFDAPLTMHYPNLDRRMRYRLRVVHSGDAPHMKIRLMANDSIEIHPYMLRVWPPAPREFSIPPEATANGELKRHGRANRAWEATGAVARWPKFGLFQPPQRSLHNGKRRQHPEHYSVERLERESATGSAGCGRIRPWIDHHEQQLSGR